MNGKKLEISLAKKLKSEAENFELQADLSAANLAKERISGDKVPEATQEEAIVEENDDKLFARALRRAAPAPPDSLTCR